MNKNIVIIAVILLVGFGAYYISSNKGTTNESNQSTAQTYYNAARGIKFQYPSEWSVDSQVVDGPNPIIAKFDKDADTSLQLLHSENIDDLTFDSYATSSLEALEFTPGYTLISEETIDVNGVKTYQVTATYEGDIKGRSIYFMSPDNSRLFVIIYRSTQDKFDQFLSEFEGTLNTLELN